MAKADSAHTTTRHRLPPDDLVQPVLDRMKAIVEEAGRTLLLADGPSHPDWELLDLCAEAMHYVKQAEMLAKQGRAMHDGREWTAAVRAQSDAFWCEQREWEARAQQCLRRAKKIRATSGAGIYAKAMLVRGSHTGARDLAMSLAADLLDCAPLRATLWAAAPAAAEGMP